MGKVNVRIFLTIVQSGRGAELGPRHRIGIRQEVSFFRRLAGTGRQGRGRR